MEVKGKTKASNGVVVDKVVWIVFALPTSQTHLLLFALYVIHMEHSFFYIFRFAIGCISILCLGSMWLEFFGKV